ncbi:hypothetical protein [Burkholderia stabilis]|uniref:hypothetical protein n=1 Tax=Burkholderia stabilis TaxID=95485 RepID=UPI001E3995EB|nr:hypothetical protein [Burkholderia stabilis]
MVHRSRPRRPVAAAGGGSRGDRPSSRDPVHAFRSRRRQTIERERDPQRPETRGRRDVERTLRRCIQVSNLETTCRMIEANVDVLPEGIARRDAKTIAPHLMTLESDRAKRSASSYRSASPIPARCRASRAISPSRSSRLRSAPDRPDSHAFERQSVVFTPIPPFQHGKCGQPSFV